MNKTEHLEARIAVLEKALSLLLQCELQTLSPHCSQRWNELSTIHNDAKQSAEDIDLQYLNDNPPENEDGKSTDNLNRKN